jgi:hypothetical protein
MTASTDPRQLHLACPGHHWIIPSYPTAEPGIYVSTCKRCGAERVFKPFDEPKKSRAFAIAPRELHPS